MSAAPTSPSAPGTQSSRPPSPDDLEGRIVSVETLKIALEAVQMVYKHNVVWLQTQGREKEYTQAIDELEKVTKSESETNHD